MYSTLFDILRKPSAFHITHTEILKGFCSIHLISSLRLFLYSGRLKASNFWIPVVSFKLGLKIEWFLPLLSERHCYRLNVFAIWNFTQVWNSLFYCDALIIGREVNKRQLSHEGEKLHSEIAVLIRREIKSHTFSFVLCHINIQKKMFGSQGSKFPSTASVLTLVLNCQDAVTMGNIILVSGTTSTVFMW